MNNPINMIFSMLQQSGNNPQGMAQNLLNQNPNVANMLQGQNPKDFAFQLMQQRGINPHQVESMMNSMRH